MFPIPLAVTIVALKGLGTLSPLWTFLASFILLLMNTVFEISVRDSSTVFEKHPSIDDRNWSVFWRFFFFRYFNTSCVYFLVMSVSYDEGTNTTFKGSGPCALFYSLFQRNIINHVCRLLYFSYIYNVCMNPPIFYNILNSVMYNLHVRTCFLFDMFLWLILFSNIRVKFSNKVTLKKNFRQNWRNNWKYPLFKKWTVFLIKNLKTKSHPNMLCRKYRRQQRGLFFQLVRYYRYLDTDHAIVWRSAMQCNKAVRVHFLSAPCIERVQRK